MSDFFIQQYEKKVFSWVFTCMVIIDWMQFIFDFYFFWVWFCLAFKHGQILLLYS